MNYWHQPNFLRSSIHRGGNVVKIFTQEEHDIKIILLRQKQNDLTQVRLIQYWCKILCTNGLWGKKIYKEWQYNFSFCCDKMMWHEKYIKSLINKNKYLWRICYKNTKTTYIFLNASLVTQRFTHSEMSYFFDQVWVPIISQK